MILHRSKGKGLPKIIHIKGKNTDSSLGLRSIASKYHHSVVFGEVWKSDGEIAKQIIPNGGGTTDAIGVYKDDKFEPLDLTFPLKHDDLLGQIERLLKDDAKGEL